MATQYNLIRSELSAIEPYNSGLSIEHVKQLYAPDQISKLGSNENPHGPSPKVSALFKNLEMLVNLYPDSSGSELRNELEKQFQTSSEQIILGNGSEDLLSVISRTFLRNKDRVITLYPSFPLHEDYAKFMGATVDPIAVNEHLEIDGDALIAAASKPARMLMFANPMNPVGAWLNPENLSKVIEATHSKTLIVLDEAYFEYANGNDYASGIACLKASPNPWIVLRTFSKAWGLAGLRIGFGVCSSPELKQAMDKTRTPFNVNSFAQTAALEAMKDTPHMQKCVEATLIERNLVRHSLEEWDYKVAPSNGNFLFFQTKGCANTTNHELLKRGVIVKPWKQKSFDSFLRVSIGTPSENKHFLHSLSAIEVDQ
ncbi:MAG: histidinol-phosphate transaminase [Hyphomicrobiales bacterium]